MLVAMQISACMSYQSGTVVGRESLLYPLLSITFVVFLSPSCFFLPSSFHLSISLSFSFFILSLFSRLCFLFLISHHLPLFLFCAFYILVIKCSSLIVYWNLSFDVQTHEYTSIKISRCWLVTHGFGLLIEIQYLSAKRRSFPKCQYV